MFTINFSNNWNNKLNNRAFTTIRLKNNNKYFTNNIYYINLDQKGKQSVNFGTAQCIAIKHFKLAQLTEFTAHVDTGYNKTECEQIIRRMYSKSNINWEVQELSLILLKYT